jgi:uncharacterized heparinase superfamily protein
MARLWLGFDSAVGRRLDFVMRNRYTAPAGMERRKGVRIFGEPPGMASPELTREAENARRLQDGVFRLLNHDVFLGTPTNWNPADTTRLWRYNLHYFDYALDLGLLAKWENDRASASLLQRLLQDWMAHNPVGEGVGWHSYPLARRIVNWIQSAGLVQAELWFPGPSGEASWLGSLWQQTRYLEDHLEFDCLGNHLLANGKALIFAGVFFGVGPGARWYERGEKILLDGLRDQILEDGGHEERSPMYHSIVLQDYLEVILLLRLNGRDLPRWARDRLVAMADFLDGMRHPDGEIALFADSALGIARRPDDLLAAAERLLGVRGRWREVRPGPYGALLNAAEVQNEETIPAPLTGPRFWSATGYVAIPGASSDDRLMIDAKPIGPSHLPAHGHCSLFSYELSLQGRRIIVDSGVEEYQAGAWRNFWRSTRAHNTVTVDGGEQAEIWASFRAGRRTRLLQSMLIRNESSTLFAGCHGGFQGQGRPTPHCRFIAALGGGVWLVLDEISGKGRHRVESFVHFAPETQCRIGEKYTEIGLETMRLRIYPWVQGIEPMQVSCLQGQTDPIQGWYAPEFGVRQQNPVLCFSSEALLPVRLGYLIAPDDYDVISWDLGVRATGEGDVVTAVVRQSSHEIKESFLLPRSFTM